jgi:cytochrome c oxidase assembly protein subunit 15
VVNVLIVLTGALVRLTGSGLGCPTWPRCTGDSFVTTAEMGVHGLVEFGNRVLGVLVGMVAVGLVVVLLRHRRRPSGSLALAVGVLVGVGVQGLVGGLSVRRELAPEIVACHFLASMALIAALTVLIDLLRRPRARFRIPVDRRIRLPAVALPIVVTVTLVLGTLVTGSGPHAGDGSARRLDLDSTGLTSAHAFTVVMAIGLQAAVLAALHVAGAAAATRRAAIALLAVSFTQGVIGSAQNLLALPVPLVAAHVLLAALTVLATTHLVARIFRSTTTTTTAEELTEGRSR